MKKILAILVLTLFVGQAAFAFTPTVTSRQRYEDSQGTTYERVLGNLAFDTAYPCNSSTTICGESLLPNQLGLASVTKMTIENEVATAVGAGQGGLIVFKYHKSGKGAGATTGSSIEGGNVRAYVESNLGANFSGPLVSMASYDLSALTAVPFEAVGPVL